MTKTTSYLFIITVSLLSGPLAMAQEGLQIGVTAFGGYNNPGHLTLQNVRSGLNGTGVAGVRFETTFARIIGIEHTLAVMPDFGAPDVLQSLKNGTGLIYNTNLTLNLPIGRLVPYATTGIGLVHSGRVVALFEPGETTPTAQGTFGTRFAYNYGGGIKFVRLAGPLGIRLDARGYTLPGVFSQRLHLFEVSGGLLITF
jgi:hypothetical protein